GGFEKLVALKRIQRELLETRHQAIELFLNEAKIAGRLTHPNIVQVLDVGEVAGALYLAMEYVHGKDLRDVLKKLQQSRMMMPLGEACYLVREVAQALHHAYWSTDMTGQQLAVVHRDVSPHNIILSYDGTVKLLDFGVAISAVTERAEAMIVGKWLYMSPETTTNQHIDHRSDLFSLGVILYLLCSGHMPFTGRDTKEIVKKIRAGHYKPLPELVAVPERLAVLVGRMLSPNPDDRPQRGQEVATELNEIARQYGMESSSPRIASILQQLFPEEVFGGAEAAPVVRELVMDSKSPGSLGGPDSSISVRNRSPSASISPVRGVGPVSRPFPAVLPGTNATAPLPQQFATAATIPGTNPGMAAMQAMPSGPSGVPRQFATAATLPGINPASAGLAVAPPRQRAASASIPPGPASGPVARQSAPITRRKSSSSQLRQGILPPVYPTMPMRPTAPSSRSVPRILITIAVVIVFVIGVILLFRSD
ncbi:MAG: protein kinase, partial [Kofleriaceae bacterium]